MTGFIIIDKEQGKTSMQEVACIKRLSSMPCGHMGTLDPMASGVLPIAIGNATRLFDYFLTKKKTYIAQFKFGIDTDTLDTTGTVLSDNGYIPTEEQIEAVIPQLLGEVDQLPPKYSAKNVGGRRSYELARAGVEFELKTKRVTIYSIELIKKVDSTTYEFLIECGGGTYIRSIARDMAKLLNTFGVMSSLIRTKSGIFNIEKSVKTQTLTKENLAEHVIATDSVLPFDGIYPEGNDAKRLFNGLSIKCNKPNGTYKIYSPDGSFYGLAEVENSYLKIRIKLC